MCGVQGNSFCSYIVLLLLFVTKWAIMLISADE